jgi:hypothetical protein
MRHLGPSRDTLAAIAILLLPLLGVIYSHHRASMHEAQRVPSSQFAQVVGE